MRRHRQIMYVKAPDGPVEESCFRMEEAPVPAPADGQVLVRTHYLSIDPYMRRQMSNARSSYTHPLKPGGVMIGRGAGIVIESRHPDFVVGDAVQSEFGWRETVVLEGKGLRKLAADIQPLSLSLGVLGQSGATAWVGLYDIAGLKGGETVLVSAAAGAVGSAVGQIARIAGCRAIGIAGGPEKCRHVVEDLGFDHCIDYKAGLIDAALRAAAPRGIDVYFDNVGGEILDAALSALNEGGRVAICGMISQYDARTPAERAALRNVGLILDKSLAIRGFRIGQHLAQRDVALDSLLGLFRRGQLRYRETVTSGLDSAPGALISMLKGGNVGKQVVRLV